MSDFLFYFSPYLAEFIAGVAVAIFGLVAERLRKSIGLTIEEKHRAALHHAIATGVGAALTRSNSSGDVVEKALDYARRSVPEALHKLSPSADVLKAIALSKVGVRAYDFSAS